MLKVTDKEIWINPTYKNNLDSLVHNIKKDWETILIFSGDGLLRVGKTMLATQTAYYMAYELGTPFSVENVVFSGQELIEKATKFPKNSVFVYDESLSEMSSKRVMESVSKNLMEFFSECGMYNHVIILVLPDYFDLNKSIALNRSEALINVVRGKKIVSKGDNEIVEWERGIYEFYNRSAKKYLYLSGAKNKTYSVNGKRCFTFWGNFNNKWVIDKEAYEQKKKDYIKRDREKEKTKAKTSVFMYKRDLIVLRLAKRFKQQEVAEMCGLTQTAVTKIISKYREKEFMNNEYTKDNTSE